MRKDVSFDPIADAFERDIYETSKGQVRLQVLQKDMLANVPAIADGGLAILDVGGGAGRIAIWLASMGNRVVLSDPSAEMLQRAARAIGAAGADGQVQIVKGSLQELATTIDERFDVVTCHAVLEWLADPASAVAEFTKLMKPGGTLSLLFYNENAATLKRVLQAARTDGRVGAAQHWGSDAVPLAEGDVRQWLASVGLRIRSKAGIRIFHDLVVAASLDGTRLEALIASEEAFRDQEPFASLGQHIHLVCTF
jgi:S-adenosylmethionine-dependent methyltransferase